MGIVDLVLFVPRKLFGIFKTVFIFRSVRSATKSLKTINTNISGVNDTLKTSFNQLYKGKFGGMLVGPAVGMSNCNFNEIHDVKEALKILKESVPPAEPVARHYGDTMTVNNFGMLQAASNVSNIESFEREVGVRKGDDVINYNTNKMVEKWGTNKELLIPSDEGGVRKFNGGFLKALKIYSDAYSNYKINDMKDYPVYEPLNKLGLDMAKSFEDMAKRLEVIWGIVGVMHYLVTKAPESLTNLWEKARAISEFKSKEFPSNLKEGINKRYKVLGGELKDLSDKIRDVKNVIEGAQEEMNNTVKDIKKDFNNTTLETLFEEVEKRIRSVLDNFIVIKNNMYQEVFWRLNSEVMAEIGNILLEIYKVDDRAYDKVLGTFKNLENLREQFEKEIGISNKKKLNLPIR